jgi:hypothetical protein
MAQVNIVKDTGMLLVFSMNTKSHVLLTIYVVMDYRVVNAALRLMLMLY